MSFRQSTRSLSTEMKLLHGEFDAIMQIQQRTSLLQMYCGRNVGKSVRPGHAHMWECGGQRRTHMRESEVEKQFVEAVRAAGGQALKFTSQTMNGVPDRLVLLLGGKCAFVELKAPGKQMRLLQRKRRQQLETLGFPVFCVDRPEQIRPAINALLKWNPGDPIPQGIGATIPEMPVMELPETNTVTDTETNTEEVMPK